MSPRHEFDPTAVSSSLEVLPKGDYLLSVGEPKAFQGVTKGGPNIGNANWGIRWALRVEEVYEGDPNAKGKRILFNGFLHNPDSAGFAKSLLMAALGFRTGHATTEREFNDKFPANLDWSYDTDSGAVGDMWRQSTGKNIVASLDMQPNPEAPGEFQQRFIRIYPVDYYLQQRKAHS